jgi:hypothetical protein
MLIVCWAFFLVVLGEIVDREFESRRELEAMLLVTLETYTDDS